MSDSVKTIDNFLTKEQCTYLINKYKNNVVRSTVISTDNKSFIDNSRTSSTYYIPDSDNVIIEIKKKVSNFLNIPIENIEGIQFLRYMKGEQYKYHYDYLLNKPQNQRVHTILVYLNDLEVSDGGATSFYYYKMKVNPKEGMGVWFRNMAEDGTLITESLHSGEEILSDNVIKYALNIWTRQYKI